MTKHAAYFDVSYELLADLLCLPEGTVIRRVVDPNEGVYLCQTVVRFVVEHPDLPEVREADQLQRAMPSHRRLEDGTVEFATWGLSK